MNTLCIIYNKAGLHSSMHNNADGQAEIKASFSKKPVDKRMIWLAFAYCCSLHPCKGTTHVPKWKELFHKGCSGGGEWGWVYKLSFVILGTGTLSILIWHHHVCLGENLSSGKVVSMVTGRVEVREEVERTGCSESVREEVVQDAYKHSSLPALHTQTQSSLRFTLWTPHLSVTIQSSFCSPAFLGSGGGTHWSSPYLWGIAPHYISLITSALSLSLSYIHIDMLRQRLLITVWQISMSPWKPNIRSRIVVPTQHGSCTWISPLWSILAARTKT